jgi:hypothetical protein
VRASSAEIGVWIRKLRCNYPTTAVIKLVQNHAVAVGFNFQLLWPLYLQIVFMIADADPLRVSREHWIPRLWVPGTDFNKDSVPQWVKFIPDNTFVWAPRGQSLLGHVGL